MLLVSVLLLNGCAAHTTQYPKFTAEKMNEYQMAPEKDGLSVAFYPLTKQEEVVKYFGKDLLGDGIRVELRMPGDIKDAQWKGKKFTNIEIPMGKHFNSNVETVAKNLFSSVVMGKEDGSGSGDKNVGAILTAGSRLSKGLVSPKGSGMKTK